MHPMKNLMVVLLMVVGLAGCVVDWNGDGQIVVACLGDSNTDEFIHPVAAPTWCSKVGTGHGWIMLNYAVSGAPTQPIPNDGDINVVAQLHRMLSDGWRPDVLIVASGTNDMIRWDSQATPESIVTTLQQIDAEAEAAGIHDRWYGSIPPMDPSVAGAQAINAVIQQVNQVLRDGLGTKVIDLYTGFDQHEYFMDIVHFNQAGQEARAQYIASVIR